MEWICGVSGPPTGTCLRTVDVAKDEHVRPFTALQSVFAYNGKLTKVRGNISFADWRELKPAETDAVAEELGFPPGCSGQAFYGFEAEGQRYIIPAGVLMCALFRPFHGIAKYLFAPQGLDNLCIPYGNCEKPELLFFITPRRATGMQADKAQGILNSLSWMHCFPSARQMWCSVSEYAMQGRLDLKLPIGLFQYAGSAGLLASGDVLICDFRIRLLKTEEEPIAQFSMHTKTIEFERVLHKLNTVGIAQQNNCKYLPDLTIPLRDGDWTLTDKEWAAIEDIVVLINTQGRFANARRLLNLQLQKLSQGLPWSRVTIGQQEQTACRKSLNRMQVDGRWDILVKRLRGLRSAN
jgi:hypothetical protein